MSTVQKVFCRPRVWERAILLCAHTTIYRFYSPGLPKEPLDCSAQSTVCLKLPWKVASRFDGCLYGTARGSFKDLISRRGWIKIRMSSFLESKCIIVRFRTMVARPLREEPSCYYRYRCFLESHWRVVVQPRPLDVETSVPTIRIERTLALLSDSHAREAARRRVGCAAQNSCSFERRVSLPSNADIERKFIAPAKERVFETFFRFEEPPYPSCDWFTRWKIDRPASLAKTQRGAARLCFV